jgi:hypothetical protein
VCYEYYSPKFTTNKPANYPTRSILSKSAVQKDSCSISGCPTLLPAGTFA